MCRYALAASSLYYRLLCAVRRHHWYIFDNFQNTLNKVFWGRLVCASFNGVEELYLFKWTLRKNMMPGVSDSA